MTKLMLEEISLGGKLKPRVENQDRLGEVLELIKSIESSKIAAEMALLPELKQERERLQLGLQYSEFLDLSFLSMYNEINYKGRKLQVPRFSIYPTDINAFSIHFYRRNKFQERATLTEFVGPMGILGMGMGGIFGCMAGICCNHPIWGAVQGASILGSVCAGSVAIGMGSDYLRKNISLLEELKNSNQSVGFTNSSRCLPSEFHTELIKAMEFYQYAKPVQGSVFRCRDIPRRIRRKYEGDNSGDLTITSEIGLILPAETKVRLAKAQEFFPKERLYFIAETKPEEWNVRTIKEDPLLVGIAGSRCFYIDDFNAAPLERYIGRSGEFTK